MPTFGGFSRLEPGQQAAILAGTREAVDAAGGGFTMGYATVAVTTSRR